MTRDEMMASIPESNRGRTQMRVAWAILYAAVQEHLAEEKATSFSEALRAAAEYSADVTFCPWDVMPFLWGEDGKSLRPPYAENPAFEEWRTKWHADMERAKALPVAEP